MGNRHEFLIGNSIRFIIYYLALVILWLPMLTAIMGFLWGFVAPGSGYWYPVYGSLLLGVPYAFADYSSYKIVNSLCVVNMKDDRIVVRLKNKAIVIHYSDIKNIASTVSIFPSSCGYNITYSKNKKLFFRNTCWIH